MVKRLPSNIKRRLSAFTLIELLVVMAILAMLLTLAVPRYFHSVDRSKEAVLRENLFTMREAIDKYYGDTGKYPDAIEDLITQKYLRKLPVDPITGSTTTWIAVAPEETDKGNLYDVKSGAEGAAQDGTSYNEW